MKKYAFFTIVMAALSVAGLSAAITQVTVYPQGAQITDERSVELKAGINNIDLGTLGQGVNADSLRVMTPSGVRVVDRALQVAHTPAEQNAARASLEGMLRQAMEKVQIIDDRLTLINKKEAYFDKIENASTQPTDGDNYVFPPASQWESLITFLQNGRTANQKERRSTQAERLLAAKEVESLRRQIDELGSSPTLYQQKLMVKVEALKDQKAILTLSYFDPNASWRPAYQVWVEAEAEKKAVQLIYGAQVRQATSQSWDNVALTLSTARPQTSATPPQLTPWWLTEMQPMPAPASYASARLMKMSLNESTAMDAAGASMERFDEVQVEQNLTFAQFRIPGTQTVPADSEEHRFVVAELPLKGELSYKIIPELSTDAYLQAKVTNSSDFTLLPGASQLYSSGNFVGQGSFATVQPGEAFDLDLGVDPAIKLERKQLARKVDLTGFDQRKVTFQYSTEITNQKKSLQRVIVTERIPLSQHEKIKVQLLEPKRAAKDIDAEGKISWELNLAPGKKEVLPLSYSVEHPKKMPVQGL